MLGPTPVECQIGGVEIRVTCLVEIIFDTGERNNFSFRKDQVFSDVRTSAPPHNSADRISR